MMKNIDFQIVLLRFINSLDIPLTARIDYFEEKDDLVLNAIPGGRVEEVFMDGTREVVLPYEIAVKSLNNQLANDIIWSIQTALSDFDLTLDSQNGSYTFLNLDVEKPSVNGKDEQNYFIYTLNLTAKIEIEKGE